VLKTPHAGAKVGPGPNQVIDKVIDLYRLIKFGQGAIASQSASSLDVGHARLPGIRPGLKRENAVRTLTPTHCNTLQATMG